MTGAEPYDAIGFDLDMTLVDTRRGIHTALVELAAETGRPIDADAVVAALGPPVAEALSPWFAGHELPDAVERFRAHMARVGVQDVVALPGAADAIAAARELGHRVVVVTSKLHHLAVATLEHAGLDVAEVSGEVWAEDKAGPLRAAGAVAFVGDHPADMVAARHAGADGVGVTSGASSPDELYAAGARIVLRSLDGIRGWLPGRQIRGGDEVRVEDRLLAEAEARFIAGWRYPSPYATYETTEEDGWRKMLDRAGAEGFYPVLVGTTLAGFVCFGAEARVAGQTVEAGTCDVGMGLRPDALSLGIGGRAMTATEALAVGLFRPRRLRAAVLAFNDRSLQLCRSAGYAPVREFDNAEGRFVELIREL